jgi:adenylate cyclase 10
MGIKTMSHKALRSIIVKQIQNKLAKSNNDPSTIIKEGYLDKKSGKNYTWAMRYCVMDGKEFKYYYGFKES